VLVSKGAADDQSCIAGTVQGDHSSWKVMEFSKNIFQAWKVMENSQSHGKSWKVTENDDDVKEFFVKMH